MLRTIESKLQKEAHRKYQNLDRKLNKQIQSQTAHPQQKHSFYPRVVNNTDKPFSKCKMALLQKGLKYNLHTKQKNWIRDLALEAETATQKLPTSYRDMYRHMVAECINTLQLDSNTHSKQNNAQQETKTIKSIQSKIQSNDVTITCTDKGNSIVILPTQQYNLKLQEFIHNNNFKTTQIDPTKTFQSQIRKTINSSKILIPQESRMEICKLESISTHHKRPY